jgi:hypothetical protein
VRGGQAQFVTTSVPAGTTTPLPTLLENTDDSIDAIAQAAGMGTATTLRRHFHRTVGVPPDAYPRTFRGAGAKLAGSAAGGQRGHAPKWVGPVLRNNFVASTSSATARPIPNPAWLLNSKCWPPYTRERPASVAAAQNPG